MHTYERLTFLLVAGTLGLLGIAIVLAIVGVLFTLYPEIERISRSYASMVIAFSYAVYIRARELTITTYQTYAQGRFQTRRSA